ncbi:unnamed protein product [Rotaria socialis]|nr:unnamed protein product [Rotaria magnacalcarata]CAF3173848.1 unnamed protein product [Rotaria socialis]CAF1634369.1 unnamed protein product [Rotaria magnacalcarata]CAF2139803.1 unnamed protein product [Rotaria magnacalcarata]CAF3418528.1 unnamed protein product [Rotaria socialis]
MESNKKTKSNLAKMELKKLKSILPTLKQKPTTTPIEIVLETIRYIRQLEDQLIDRFQMESVPCTSRTSLSEMSTDSSLLQDISNTD